MEAHKLTSEVYYEGKYKLTGKARKGNSFTGLAIMGGIVWILSLLIRKQM